jgi:hypothetical protein
MDVRRNRQVTLEVLLFGGLVNLIIGIVAGIAEHWGWMALNFFVCVLVVLYLVDIVVWSTTEACFAELERRFLGSTLPATKSTRPYLNLFWVAGVGLVAALAGMAGHHQNWLQLGFYLVAWFVVAALQMGMLSVNAVNRHLKRIMDCVAEKEKNNHPSSEPQTGNSGEIAV